MLLVKTEAHIINVYPAHSDVQEAVMHPATSAAGPKARGAGSQGGEQQQQAMERWAAVEVSLGLWRLLSYKVLGFCDHVLILRWVHIGLMLFWP